MKFHRHQTIAGQPIRKIRDLLRFVAGSEFAAPLVSERVGADVTDQLLAEGLIEPTHVWQSEELESTQFYEVTQKGTRLALTRLNRRIRRRTAEEIVAAFLQRVEAINADPDLLLRVVRVHVFGSYMTDAPDLSDVDLAVELERRSFPGHQWTDLNIARARASGRSLNYLACLFYGQTEVMRRLQNRSGYLSLHAFAELEQLGCEHRQIFPRPAVCDPAPRRRHRRRHRQVVARRQGHRPGRRPGSHPLDRKRQAPFGGRADVAR